jgi:glycosyltransferase involved in cell wall biosynthesis
MPAADRKLISIVAPAYNEQDNVPELATRLRAVFAANPDYDFEAIIVDNGSTDATWERLSVECAADPRFKAVQLSRNFGADGGLTAGLAYVGGDAAVLMVADLQDPPEMISTFIEKWEAGYENVYGVVTMRHGASLLRRVNSQVFYWLMNRLSDGSFPRNASDFRLVDRKVYEVVARMSERNRLLRGMFFWSGFRSIGVEHERPARFAGESKATTAHVVGLAVRGILSYSYAPLRLITYLGMCLSTLAFLYLAYIVLYIVFRADFLGVPPQGFGTTVGLMLLMFGFLFTILGVIAEYLGLIYEEVKQRPNFVVRDKIGL